MMSPDTTPLAQRLVAAVAAVLPASYDRSCGVPPSVTRDEPTTSPTDWMTEARDAVVAVLRELARRCEPSEPGGVRIHAVHSDGTKFGLGPWERAGLRALADSIEKGAE
jgi:hypothetical protein